MKISKEIGHLLWIIPVTIFLTAVFVHPNLHNEAQGWSPAKDVYCYNIENKLKGITLSNCSDGKTYESLRGVQGTNLTTDDFFTQFYCGMIIDEVTFDETN